MVLIIIIIGLFQLTRGHDDIYSADTNRYMDNIAKANDIYYSDTCDNCSCYQE